MEDTNGREIIVEGWSFFEGKLNDHNQYTCQPKWISEEERFGTKNISIGSINPAYIEVNEIQDKDDEYKKIKKFLNKYLEKHSKKKGVPIEDLSIEFINYGKTELVYVLSEKKR